ncbi:MAG: hypothetical protein AAFR12_21415 [Cyanobacteria bacterium J06626_6]
MANTKDNRLAIAVEYIERDGELKISLDDDSKHLIRVARLQMEEWDGEQIKPISKPSTQELSDVVVWGGGSTICFPQIQQYFRVADLMAGVYGDEKWCVSL